jgi:hypothetical protein
VPQPKPPVPAPASSTSGLKNSTQGVPCTQAGNEDGPPDDPDAPPDDPDAPPDEPGEELAEPEDEPDPLPELSPCLSTPVLVGPGSTAPPQATAASAQSAAKSGMRLVLLMRLSEWFDTQHSITAAAPQHVSRCFSSKVVGAGFPKLP